MVEMYACTFTQYINDITQYKYITLFFVWQSGNFTCMQNTPVLQYSGTCLGDHSTVLRTSGRHLQVKYISLSKSK